MNGPLNIAATGSLISSSNSGASTAVTAAGNLVFTADLTTSGDFTATAPSITVTNAVFISANAGTLDFEAGGAVTIASQSFIRGSAVVVDFGKAARAPP